MHRSSPVSIISAIRRTATRPISRESCPDETAPGSSGGPERNPHGSSGGSESRTPGFLLICGSLHENALAQVRDASDHGYPVHILPKELLFRKDLPADEAAAAHEGQTGPAADVISAVWKEPADPAADVISAIRKEPADPAAEIISAVRKELAAPGTTILATADCAGSRIGAISPAEKDLADKNVGILIRRLVDTGLVRTLCIFGGDTMVSVMRALNVRMLRIYDQLVPGVVRGSLRYKEKDIAVISKAGSFGGKDLIRTHLAPVISRSPLPSSDSCTPGS